MQQVSKAHQTTINSRKIDQTTSPLATYSSDLAYIPQAAMTMRRRRTAERFICEGAIAAYLVEVSTLKKTTDERADLLTIELED